MLGEGLEAAPGQGGQIICLRPVENYSAFLFKGLGVGFGVGGFPLFVQVFVRGYFQMSTVLGLKLTSAASERPVLQHSCGSGQRGPADPAGEVGRERTRSSLPLPAGRKKRQAFQERQRRAQLPGRPKARRVSCSSCSAAHKAPVPRHPERRTRSAASLAPLRPGLTRGPKPGTVLTRQFLSSSFANKQHGLSP